jgi:beta-galactosidase GanA
MRYQVAGEIVPTLFGLVGRYIRQVRLPVARYELRPLVTVIVSSVTHWMVMIIRIPCWPLSYGCSFAFGEHRRDFRSCRAVEEDWSVHAEIRNLNANYKTRKWSLDEANLVLS